jgi:F420-dependent oxidoreductase-like protein
MIKIAPIELRGKNLSKTKFGVFLPFYAFKSEQTFKRIRNLVLECERLKYDSIWLDDHLMYGKHPILECWTTLSALASLTARIRLGTMVLCNSYRNPALLAKMAATFDVISNGRLEFGIGAGVQEDEHKAYGMPFLKASDRISRMKEATEIIKKMWTEEKANYHGKYYTINEAECLPKPLQKPHPPITIGGGGEKLTMRVAAQHAERCDWGYMQSIEQYRHKLEILKNHCNSVGRDFQEMEKSCWLGGQIFIAQNRQEIDEKVSQWKPQNISLEDFKKSSFIVTPDECKQKIREYLGLGVTHFMLFFGDLPALSGLRLFADKVVKTLN